MDLSKFLIVFVLFTTFSSNIAYPIQVFENRCNPTGILCKSSTTYTFCSTIGNEALYIVLNEFFCPEGYFCNEDINFPCVLGDQTTQVVISEITTILSETTSDITTEMDKITTLSDITTDLTEIDEITTITTLNDVTSTEIVTMSTTIKSGETTEEVTEFVTPSSTKKPILPPNCITKGFHPGPICSQYYECVSEYFWSYKAVLRNCDEGLYFSSSTKTCVEASISGCVD